MEKLKEKFITLFSKKLDSKKVILLVIVFLLIYSLYVFIIFKNRPESAYSSLIKYELELMNK